MKLSNTQLRLAYLSACSTSESLAEDLANETLNIANAFQLLGFPHIIGTLWEAEVESAYRLADFFDAHLVKAFRTPLLSINQQFIRMRCTTHFKICGWEKERRKEQSYAYVARMYWYGCLSFMLDIENHHHSFVNSLPDLYYSKFCLDNFQVRPNEQKGYHVTV